MARARVKDFKSLEGSQQRAAQLSLLTRSIQASPRPPAPTRQYMHELRMSHATAVDASPVSTHNAQLSPAGATAAAAPHPSVPNIVLYPPPEPRPPAQHHAGQDVQAGQEAVEVLGATVDDLDYMLYPGQQTALHHAPTGAELDSLINSEQQALIPSKGHLEQHAPGRPPPAATDGDATAQEVQAMLPVVERMLQDLPGRPSIASTGMMQAHHSITVPTLGSAGSATEQHRDGGHATETTAMLMAWAAQQQGQQTWAAGSVQAVSQAAASGPSGHAPQQSGTQLAPQPGLPQLAQQPDLPQPSLTSTSHLHPSSQQQHAYAGGYARRWLQTPEPPSSQQSQPVPQQLPLPLPLPPGLAQATCMMQPSISHMPSRRLQTPSLAKSVVLPKSPLIPQPPVTPCPAPPPQPPQLSQQVQASQQLAQQSPQQPPQVQQSQQTSPAQGLQLPQGPQGTEQQLQPPVQEQTMCQPHPTPQSHPHPHPHPHPPPLPQNAQNIFEPHPPCLPQPQQMVHVPQPPQVVQQQPQLQVRPWLRASMPSIGSAGAAGTPAHSAEQPTVGGFLGSAASVFRTLVTGPLQRIGTMKGASTSDSGTGKPAAHTQAGSGQDQHAKPILAVQPQPQTGRTRRGSVVAVLSDSLLRRAATDAGALAAAGLADDPASPLPSRAVTSAGFEVTFKAVPVLRHPDSIRRSQTTQPEGAVSSKSRHSSMLAFFGVGSKRDDEQRALQNTVNRSRQSRRASLVALLTGDLSAAKALITGDGGGDHASRAMTPANSRGRRSSVIDVISSMLTAKTETLQVPEEELVFTSLDDFRPINFKYKQTRNMRMYFACAKANGIHYILRKYDLEAMDMSDMRTLRGALALRDQLDHPGLLRIRGHWETDDAIYVVEDLAKSDLMSDSLSHPEKYTEAFLARNVVKPLLNLLAYLHSQHIIHRSIQPSNLLISRTDKLLLTNYGSMLHMLEDQPNNVNDMFLDYMAPEVVSLKTADARHQESQRMGSGASVRGARRRKGAISRAASQSTLASPRTGISPGCSPRMPSIQGHMMVAAHPGTHERRHAPPQHMGSSGCEQKSQLSRMSTTFHSSSAGNSPLPEQYTNDMQKSNSQDWLGGDMLLPVREDFVHSFIERAQHSASKAKDVHTGGAPRAVAESRLPVVSGGYEPLLPTIRSQLPLELTVPLENPHQGEAATSPSGWPPESPYIKSTSRLKLTSDAGSEPGASPTPYTRTKTVSIAGNTHPGADGSSQEDAVQKLQASKPSVVQMLMQPFRSKQQDRSSHNSQSLMTSISGLITRTHSALSRTQQMSSVTSDGQSTHAGQLRMMVRQNPWEWQDEYNEKLDVWQVGCLVHELLCGCLPFETSDPRLCAALIMWADLQVFPEDLSPQCVSFIQACLRKNPAVRPSANELLHHEWITMHEAGIDMPSIATLSGKPSEGMPREPCLDDELEDAASTWEAVWTLFRTAYSKASRMGCQVRAHAWRYMQGMLGMHKGAVGPQGMGYVAGDITTVTRKAYTAYGLPAARGAIAIPWEVDE